MTLDEKDQAFLADAQAVLNRSLDELEPSTLMRLQSARRKALEVKPATFRLWMGAAAASAAALALVLWMSMPSERIPVHDVHHEVHNVDEFDLVTTAENLEFYDELEFYRWLATHDNAG